MQMSSFGEKLDLLKTAVQVGQIGWSSYFWI